MRAGSTCGVTVVALIGAAFLAAFPTAGRGAIEELVPLCDACHGGSGIPQDKSVPIIWGQHAGYTYLQLRDYKRGDRKHDQMGPIAEALERDEMIALAEYYANKPWPDLRQPRASEAVAARAMRANVAVGCTGCHLGEYQGAGAQPRLAGQTREYLARTMIDFRTGVRGNNPGMSDLMKATPEEDLAALAEYLAGR